MQDDYDGSLKHHEPFWDHQTGTGKIRPVLFPEPPWIRMDKQTPATKDLLGSPSKPILVARYIAAVDDWEFFIDCVCQQLNGTRTVLRYLDGGEPENKDFWIYLSQIIVPKIEQD